MASRSIKSRKAIGQQCTFKDSCNVSGICHAICREQGYQPFRIIQLPRNAVCTRHDLGGVLVMRSGIITSLHYSSSGQPNINVILGPKSVLGEVAALTNKELADKLLAITNSELCLLPTTLFNDVLDYNPTFYKEALSAALQNERHYCYLIWILQGDSVDDRIQRFITVMGIMELGFPDHKMSLPFSHESIALVTHCKRETVSRILKKLEEQGLVELQQRMVLIKESYWESDYLRSENSWDTEGLSF